LNAVGDIAVLYSVDAIAVRRLTISKSSHSDIGKLSFEQATVPIEKQVAEFLRMVMKRGALRTADPKIAAMHLLSESSDRFTSPVSTYRLTAHGPGD
jgi:AefR-like transcriptional repressor, C-terminal domain